MPDHVHMVLSIPPKFSIAIIVGCLKGKSAIHIHREIFRMKQGFTGKHFWSCGYCVNTAGMDEKMIPEYVRNQYGLDRQADHQGQLSFDQ